MNQEQTKLYVDVTQDIQDLTTLLEKALILTGKVTKKLNQLQNTPMTNAEKDTLEKCCEKMCHTFDKLEGEIYG